MSFNVPAPDDDIQVSVDLVPFGLPRRRENIAFLRINAIGDTSIGGFMVEGFDAGNGLGSTLRMPRTGPHGSNRSFWLLIANAAYASSHA